MSQLCNPYEPGFAECVGYTREPAWNPYLPGPLPSEAWVAVSPISRIEPLQVPTARTPDDELRLAVTAAPFDVMAMSQTPVPEPALCSLLLAAAAAARLMRRRG